MLARPLSAACCGLLAAAVAAVPARAQVRVTKDIPAAPVQAPAGPTSTTGGAVMGATGSAPAGSLAPATPAPAMAADSMTAAPAMASGPAAAGVTATAVPLPPRAPSPSGGEAPEEMYTDPKILAVASQSNFAEIDPSQIALERATRPEVKAYAQLMIDMHTRLEQGARALAARKGLQPQDNALSLQLKRNGPPTLEMLRLKSGADFDAAYVLNQIGSHDMTLKTLDTSLIPSARDPELKAVLRDTVRPQVVDHLNRIMAIHHQMMGMQPPAQQPAQPAR